MQEGFYACNTPPYGYKKDPEEAGKLIIDEKTAKTVKEIFELKLQGLTQKEIAEHLNNKKVETPAQYLRIKGLSPDIVQIWTSASVGKILRNMVYVGDCVRGKTQNISYKSKKRISIKRKDFIVVKDTHEPIISREIFDKIHNNSKTFGTIKETASKIESKFGDYIYCCYCGKKMEKRNVRGKVKLHCSSNRNSEQLCEFSQNYFYEELEILIINDIKEKFEQYFKKAIIKDKIIKKYNAQKIEELLVKSKSLDMEARKITFKISKIYNDRLNDEINEDEYRKQYLQLIEERKKVNVEKETTDSEVEKLQNNNSDLQKIKKLKKIIKSLNKESLDPEDIKELIKKIELGEGFIRIQYKFEDMENQKNPVSIE